MCLVGSSTTLVRAKIEHSLPRKRGAAAAGYDKALDAFFAKVRSEPLLGALRLCSAQVLMTDHGSVAACMLARQQARCTAAWSLRSGRQ